MKYFLLFEKGLFFLVLIQSALWTFFLFLTKRQGKLVEESEYYYHISLT